MGTNYQAWIQDSVIQDWDRDQDLDAQGQGQGQI